MAPALASFSASSGAATPTLTVFPAGDADQGDYRCAVTSAGGVTNSNSAPLSLLPTAPADLDGDCDADLADFSLFQACFNGPNRAPSGRCTTPAADFDLDGDVDLSDFSLFQACFNGPNRPPKG